MIKATSFEIYCMECIYTYLHNQTHVLYDMVIKYDEDNILPNILYGIHIHVYLST